MECVISVIPLPRNIEGILYLYVKIKAAVRNGNDAKNLNLRTFTAAC
jgi:hypothetical protein